MTLQAFARILRDQMGGQLSVNDLRISSSLLLGGHGCPYVVAYKNGCCNLCQMSLAM